MTDSTDTVIASYSVTVVVRSDAPHPTPTNERLQQIIEAAVDDELVMTGYLDSSVNATSTRTDR